ncbi:hypothetical protein OG535_27735 [Kitasatospora sp. NBC_00085]|uniref:hypothetical protein n=1 Tax=Kitasatospora sp. NBC_00085 TaxID=2903566 RepID=UPI003252382F
MALREDTEPGVHHERDRQREQHERHGRHGRPKPFGGRLRLPTLRFSGAAMAMSTVVGISIATTCLLNEQQGIGRRAGVARVGSTPPPSPDAADRADAAADAPPGPAAPRPADRSAGRPTGSASARATASHSPVPGLPAPRPASPDASAPPAGSGLTSSSSSSSFSDAPSAEALGSPSRGGNQDVTADPATAQPTDTAQPTGSAPPADQPTGQQPAYQRPFAPAAPGAPDAPGTPGYPQPGPLAPGRGQDGQPTDAPTGPAAPTGDKTDPSDHDADHALLGTAVVQPLGRDGTQHLLTLTVTEPLTALQAEFRLAPGETAPGSGWTDLSGAVVTTHQERGTLVYRFTTPAGTDVRPGRYTFGVRGTRPLPTPPGATTPGPGTGPTAGPGSCPTGPADAPSKAAPAESWTASAFGIDRPRAVATLGTFTASSSPGTDGDTGTTPGAGSARGTTPGTTPGTDTTRGTATR